jgi:hypothetical protein
MSITRLASSDPLETVAMETHDCHLGILFCMSCGRDAGLDLAALRYGMRGQGGTVR